MERKNFKKSLGIFLAILVTAFGLSPQVRGILTLPSQKKIMVGEEIKLPIRIPLDYQRYVSYELIDEANVLLSKNDKLGNPTVKAHNPGKAQLQLKLFGTVPLRNMVVDVVPEIKVVPSGESIGVLLRTMGVAVVGHSAVVAEDNQKYYPAKLAGIEVGDYILEINGKSVESDLQAAKLINEGGKTGKPVHMKIRRINEMIEVDLYPTFCKDSQSYRVGLYIKDNTAGIGTLTFYEPNTGKYGALGHLITDGGHGKLNLRGSKIVKTFVQDVKPGKKGEPGEKIGVFADDGTFSGTIEKNSFLGIYGTLNIPQNNRNYALPVALASEVQPGPAEILTVVHGSKIEKFSIEILRCMPDNREQAKGMVISITDKRLLSITGGIIQGMSGSPIIQDGKIVGAVTHVFVNDPTRGYGVFAEWMLEEAGLIKYNALLQKNKVKKAS